MESLYEFTPAQHEMVRLLFSGAFAAALAGLVWFVAMLPRIAPRWRPVTIMSIIVMVVAGWHFLSLLQSWEGAFALDAALGEGGRWVPTDQSFVNGLRYVSWLITIPLLLVQLTYLFDLPAEQLRRLRVRLVVLGEGMVVTGYVGQLGEPARSSGQLWLWFAISTVFFVGLVLLLVQQLGPTLRVLPSPAARTLRTIAGLFAVTWTAYPVAYLLALVDSPDAAVVRQLLYTFADVGSKVVYGLLLASIVRELSARDGWAGALDPMTARAAAPAASATDGDGTVG